MRAASEFCGSRLARRSSTDRPSGEAAALRVVVAEQLERVHVVGVAADDAFHELDPRIEIALGGAA